jgi:DEAD/DEAH box helicase domain-containing protein
MQPRPTRFLEGAPPGDAGPWAGWIEDLARRPENRGALAHHEIVPARPARAGELALPLPAALNEALAARGIERLYSHQVQAIEALRGGLDVVVVTGTASGKSLCYHVPVLERLLTERGATALYLFPTKALAQDQLKSLARLTTGHPDLLKAVSAGVYDGDTQAATRRRLRDTANLVLSNPDMLHQGILPYHAKWGRFLRSLRFVVVDEIHAYRGIFGSHVANVLRRLERLVRHLGGEHRVVMCSATIRNPRELAESLTGRPMTVVDDDGAPRAARHFVFWNPPHTDLTRVERRSSNVEGADLLAGLIERGAQALVFTKSRVSAELVYRYGRERLERVRPGLGEAIRSYRGGYLPEERRRIEQALFAGELRGVVSTNALELGVDIGGLDAVVSVGAPPTLASLWQQAGRAGRRAGRAPGVDGAGPGEPAAGDGPVAPPRPRDAGAAAAGDESSSLAVLVAYNETVDQYLMRHPEYFFGRSPEAAVVDPRNPYILAQQLACAAYELPLSAADEVLFGPQTPAILAALEEAGETRTIDGLAYWAKTGFPAATVNLRTISDDTYTILDASHDNAVLGTVDGISALELVYPEAVYLHEGETWFVKSLDLEQKTALVEPRVVDYYTQPVLDTGIRVRGELQARPWRARGARRADLLLANRGHEEGPVPLPRRHRLPSPRPAAAHPRHDRLLAGAGRGRVERGRAPGAQPDRGADGRAEPVHHAARDAQHVRPRRPGGQDRLVEPGAPGALPLRPLSGRPGLLRAGLDAARRAGAGGARAPRGLRVPGRLPGVRRAADPVARAAAGPRPAPRPGDPGQGGGARAAPPLARGRGPLRTT